VKTISIIGCGWLGLPLAQSLVGEYIVKGSTTSSEKLEQLNAERIEPFLLKVTASEIIGDKIDDFFQCDVLYINIPPRRKSTVGVDDYPLKVHQIMNMVHQKTKVIFISSTGVYPNTNDWVDEDMNLGPHTISNQSLIKAEGIIQKESKNWIILRMSGLVGGSRQPGKWFAGRKNISNGLAPVNLVHSNGVLYKPI